MLPSDYFQRSLPRLSIPKLEDTKQRYLKAQSVLLNPDEYKYTEDVVNKFVQGRGQGIFSIFPLCLCQCYLNITLSFKINN